MLRRDFDISYPGGVDSETARETEDRRREVALQMLQRLAIFLRVTTELLYGELRVRHHGLQQLQGATQTQ